ncbi:MAG: Crotonyl-CoA hydratase [Calditrichaeota bacterium]|nr:Crotonyl-CoA hydratase [Calditrichota bacterium]
MAYEKVRIDRDDAIVTVTIDNPKANTLSRQVVSELDQAFAEVKRMDGVRAVILTGAGKMFVAGADISELNRLTPVAAREFARTGQHLMTRIETLPVPVVAAVNGYALGGGCEIAMACTLRVASEKAVFGQPEVKLGLIPGFGGTQRLPKLVGLGSALHLLLTGEMVGAEEARRLGLVNKVVAPDALTDTAKEVAGALAKVGPLALRYAKDAAYRGLAIGYGESMRMEADLFAACYATEDVKEGTQAFLEKREAKFAGK